MKNLRPPLAALLVPFSLGILLCTEVARATLALDPTFDTDGIATVDIASGPDLARDIAVQIDGALVLAGTSRQTVATDTIDYVALTRLDGTTGAPDATFGTAGTVTLLPGLTATNGGGGDGTAVAIQPLDQKIIVAGTWRPSAAGSSQVFVARFGTNGVLDAGFGTGGVALLTPVGVTNPTGNAIALRSDGSIVVVGSGTADGAAGVGFVIVLDSTGTLDPGYSPAVIPNPLATPVGANFGFNAVTVLSGDRILAAGGGGDLTLAQFTSTGVLDTTFSGDGLATYNVLDIDTATGPEQSFDVATALSVLGDGRILVAGRDAIGSTSTSTNRVLIRVSSSGTLDATFGSGGFAPLTDISAEEVPNGLGVRPSGDIVLVGPGFTPTQVSPNGIAVSFIAGTFAPVLGNLEVLADGNVVAAGRTTVSGTNTAFAAVLLAATDLPDGPDTVPDPFGFATQTGLEPGITATSNTVTITGLTAPAPISVRGGGSYSIGCTGFTTTPGTITNGQTVCVRAPSIPQDSTASYTQVIIGGVVGLFTLVTGDATPDQFTFVDQTDVAVSTLITSAPITLTGLTTITSVSVTGVGGTFSVGCNGTFTAQTTKVDPGTQICVRHTSSASPGGVTNTILAVGIGTTVEDTFTTTTAGDATPDSFSFVDQVDVAKSTVITSASVTLTGFTSNTAISVTGGEYSLGCTASFTSAAGTVAPNATVCVRHTSSSVGGTATNTTLTVGAEPGLTPVSDTFTSTTAGAPDTTPDAFTFVDQTGTPLAAVITSGAITIGGFDSNTTVSITGGTYSVGCGSTFTSNPSSNFAPNSLICVRHTSASTGGTATDTVLTVGGVSDTFTSTTMPGDAVPAPFSFVDQTGVDLSAPVTSAPVTITGIDIASPITVTDGEYSIGCTSTFTSAAANISNGQTVCVRQTSSFDSNTSVNTTLTIGTVSDTFTSTTKTGDQTPDDFSFTSQTNVALETLTTSNTITITGIDSPAAVTASGPQDNFNRPLFAFSVGCTGTFDGKNGDLVKSGDTLCVGVVSASADLSGVVVTVTIGGSTPGTQTSATFTVTTGETVPDQFTFTDRVGVLLGETVYSDPITITGITAPSKVSITQNGQYQIDCTGGYTGSAGVVSNGQTICVRQIAASSLATLTDTVLTVGGVSDTFTSTTVVDKPLPGSSAMDAWSILLLAPLGIYRRCRSAFRRDRSSRRA